MRNSFFIALFVALSLLLAGCGSKPIFSKVIDGSIVGVAPKSAKITGDEYGVVKIASNPASNIEIRVQKVRASCSTERARSLGSDFDGYILFEVYKEGKLSAKAQMDFKIEPSKKDFERVWSELVTILKWQS